MPMGSLLRSAKAANNDLVALLPFFRNSGWPGGPEEEQPVTAPVLLVVADDDQYMVKVDELLRWLSHAEVQHVRAHHYAVLDDETVRAGVLRFPARPNAATVTRQPLSRRHGLTRAREVVP